ncbi:hypothetical protein C8F01DRAFT_1339611 [Mycena amicta]|nr:hypothetical protein C8F01DRAFT_1339611 [Mycena amicta]
MQTFYEDGPFQRQVSAWYAHSTRKRVYASVPKCKYMIFGELPPVILTIWLGGKPVELVSEFKYHGIWLSSYTPNIFTLQLFSEVYVDSVNYSVFVAKARRAADAIFALRDRIGSLAVNIALQLYMARVDCYLIRAARLLEEIQLDFLRRLLGVGDRSIIAPLYTESGLLPIYGHRLILALGRARYLANLSESRTPYRALRDGLDLWMHRQPSWAGDLAIALSSLPIPLIIDPADLLDPKRITALMEEVKVSVDAGLQRKVEESPKCLFLRDRVELNDETLMHVTRRRRHYLTLVSMVRHRKALTRLVMSNHCLSIETLRYPTRTRTRIPRHLRLCRLCVADVEDEAHALLGCTGNNSLVSLREDFLREQDMQFLRSALASRKGVARFAKFVCDVLDLYCSYPQWVPDGFHLV